MTPLAPGKKRRYKSLDVNRVDLVDRGANFDRKSGDGSHVMLVKRDNGPAAKQALTCPACDYKLSPGYVDSGSTLPNYCPDCGAKLAIRATTKQEQTTMATETQTDVNKAIADALAKQAAETDAKIAKAVADATAAAEAKAATERAAIEKRAADLEADVKKANDATAAEVEKREVASAVTKAAQYTLVLKSDTDGPLLYRIGKALVAEDVARLDEILRSANEQIRLGKLFAEAGRSPVAMADAAGNPEQVLYAKAAELRTANPKLTEADAISEARTQFPDLRKRYDDWKSALINPTGVRA